MQIDFYVLEVVESQRALFFGCKLLEQAYSQQQKVYVHTDSKQEAERLDKLLWTYREDSFIPHEIIPEISTSNAAPIQIGFAEQSAPADVLLNLSQQVPACYQNYARIIEIVYSEANTQQLARERFKFYRSNSCDITTHKIKVNQL